jgi:hypothetical protein
MRSDELWAVLNQQQNASWLMWYELVVVPVSILALASIIIVLASTWRERHLIRLAGWVSLAWLPLILIGPSLMAHLSLISLLGWFGFQPPQLTQQLSREVLLEISAILNDLVRLGLLGVIFAIVLCVAAPLMMMISRTAGHSAQRTEQQRPMPGSGEVQSSNPVSKPTPRTPGAYQLRLTYDKSEVALPAAGETLTLGSAGDVAIDEPGVLPQHAQIIRVAEEVQLIDLSGTLGTYVLRDGRKIRLNARPLKLKAGDGILLGTLQAGVRPHLTYEYWNEEGVS